MLIKAGRITNLTDARYYAAREVDYLGFNLEEGASDFLDPMYMHAIREWVEGPAITGEFHKTAPETIIEAASFYQLDAVQVPGTEAYANVLSGTDLIVLVWLSATDGIEKLSAQMKLWSGQDRLFILDFSGRTVPQEPTPWRTLCTEGTCLLHLDAAPDEWLKFNTALKPAGFSLAGGDEEQVGVKSFDDVDAIFEALGR